MKIVLFGSYDRSLINFRGPLLREMVRAGHSVVALAPAQTPQVPQVLAEMGVRYVPFPMDRTGMNPWADLGALRRLKKILRQEKPDVILSYTIKPVIYGSLAAAAAAVPARYAMITGLGSGFYGRGLKMRVVRMFIQTLYRRALRRCHGVFVQNADIADLFSRQRIAPRGKMMLVRGSGVDLDYYSPSPPALEPIRFLYLGRLLREKGMRELFEAARLVRTERPGVVVRLVGDADENPSSISPAEIKSWQQSGIVEYFPACDDVRPHLAACSGYILPSYHEGLPRSVLEAMAAGRAIITTDVIGCRETIKFSAGAVRDRNGIQIGENGLLVPVRSAAALAAAMVRLADAPGLMMDMGRRSRSIAELEFDVRTVNAALFRGMGLASPGVTPGQQL